MLSQFIDRYIKKAFYVSAVKLLCRPDINQRHTAVTLKRLHLIPVKLCNLFCFQISNHKPCHINRILCRRIRRRISQLKLRKLICCHSRAYCSCNHIYSFIHPFIACNLRSKKTKRLLFIQNFHIHGLSSRVIGSMRNRRKYDLIIYNPCSLRCFFIYAGNSSCHFKNLNNR